MTVETRLPVHLRGEHAAGMVRNIKCHIDDLRLRYGGMGSHVTVILGKAYEDLEALAKRCESETE